MCINNYVDYFAASLLYQGNTTDFTVFSVDLHLEYAVHDPHIVTADVVIQLLYLGASSPPSCGGGLEGGASTTYDNCTSVIVTSTRIPAKGRNGELTIACGVIDRPGRYVFRMLETAVGPTLAVSEPLDAVWPKIQLFLRPLSHVVLSADAITIRMVMTDVRCESAHAHATTEPAVGGAWYVLEVVYLGRNETTGTAEGSRTRVVEPRQVCIH